MLSLSDHQGFPRPPTIQQITPRRYNRRFDNLFLIVDAPEGASGKILVVKNSTNRYIYFCVLISYIKIFLVNKSIQKVQIYAFFTKNATMLKSF